jgi:uncharacterized protein (TIGR00730 family)
MAQIKSLAIFCGSKYGNNELYRQHATELGRLVAGAGVTLIFGGGKNGLMGCAANSCMQSGGTVRGVIPSLLREREHQHDEITELLVVEDMHQRKRMLYDFCDAALILPGGFGTLDELFEIVTWNGLAIHDKKVFLLNTGNFYRHLLQHLRFTAEEGFLYGNPDEQLTVLQEPKDLLPFLKD